MVLVALQEVTRFGQLSGRCQIPAQDSVGRVVYHEQRTLVATARFGGKNQGMLRFSAL